MRKLILIMLLALSGAGCQQMLGGIAYEDAPFIAVNEAPRQIEMSVQTTGPFPVPARGRTNEFVVKIPIARDPIGTFDPTYPIDKSAYVKVVVNDPELSYAQSQECYAAPKRVTYIQYKYTPGGHPYIHCANS